MSPGWSQPQPKPHGTTRWSLLFWALAALVISLVGWLSYHMQRNLLRQSAEAQLATVCRLKVDQVRTWMDHQKRNAVGMSRGTIMALEVQGMVQSGHIPSEQVRRIDRRLATVQRIYGLSSVSVLNLDGTVLFSTRPAPLRLEAAEQPSFERAIQGGEPVFTSLHRNRQEPGQPLSLDLFTPLIAVDASGAHTVGAMYLSMDPASLLFPLIEGWPTPSRSGEILLVESEGKDVVFLNNPRNLDNAALYLRVPVGEGWEIAAEAARGDRGPIVGFDYRGRRVLARAARVAGTPWVLVTKMDEDEIYGSIWRKAALFSFAVAASILLLALLLRSWMKQRSALLLHGSEKRYRDLFDHINDAVFIIGPDDRFIEVNRVACERLGYTREELLRMGPRDINPERDAQAIATLVERARTAGHLIAEVSHRRKDGTLVPSEVSGRLIEYNGRPALLNSARDITERKQAEEALRIGSEQLKLLLDSTAEAIYGIDVDGTCTFCNPACLSLLGYERPEQLLGRNMHTLIHHTHADGTPFPQEACNGVKVVREGTGVHADDELFWRADGTSFPVEYWSYPQTRNGRIVGAVVTFLDISERRRMEDSLRQDDARMKVLMTLHERSGESEKTLTGFALDAAAQLTDSRVAYLLFVDPDGSRLRLGALSGGVLPEGPAAASGLYPLEGEGLWPDCVRLRKPVLQNDRLPLGGRPGLPVGFPECHRHLVVPILDGDRVIAIAGFGNKETDYTDRDARQLIRVMGGFWNLIRRKRAEDGFRSASERLALATRAAGIGIWDWDILPDTLLWDEEMYRLYGLLAEDFKATHPAWMHAVHPEDRARIAGEIAAALEGVRDFDTEFRVIRPDGELRHLKATAQIFRDAEGRALRMVGVNYDITDRKQAEEEIRASQARLNAIFETAGVGICVTDHEGRMLQLNAKWAEFIGCPLDQALGLKTTDFTHPEDLAASKERYEAMHAGRIESYVQEKRYLRRDGTVVWGLFSVTAIRDALGKVDRVIGIVADITEQKLAQAASQVANARFANIVQIAADAIIGIDDTQRIHLFNREAERTFGYAAEEVIGEPLSILLPERFTKAHGFQVRMFGEGAPLPAGHGGGRREVFGRRKDGSEFPAEISLSLLVEEGHTTYTAILRDITERRKAEAMLIEAKVMAEKATRAKSDFLANMSHEIRTPLNAIVGLSHLALKTDLTPKQRDYLGKVQDAGHALLNVINDILDFSKIEAGKMEVESAPFRLDTVLELVESLNAVKADEKGVKLRFSLPPAVPLHLVGDGTRLGQVLLNLVNNAVKFTEKGWVEVRVEVVERSLDLAALRFSVQDTGIGLDREQTGRLFQSFSQADSSTTRRFGGTGLGLAISKKLVELMGGEISVQSAPGKGSTFQFILPVGIGQDQPASRESGDRVSGGGLPTGGADATRGPARGRILLVEDNEINRQVAREILASEGFTVEIACDGQEAVGKVEAGGQYDAILMDVQMPVMDGIEATRRIRRLNPGIPVLAMTAHALDPERQRCLDVGMVDHISKPFDPDQLLGTLRKWIGEAPGWRPERAPGSSAEGGGGWIGRTFPGLDLASALARVGGNETLLAHLLASLQEESFQSLGQLERARDEGDEAALERIAHRIAGAAGNVSAMRVSQAARALEAAIRSGEAAAPFLEGLVAGLREVLTSLAAVVPSVPAEPEDGPALTGVDERIRPLLQELDTLIRRRSLSAKNRIEALQALLPGDGRVVPLANRVARLDFKGAQEALSALARELDPPRDPS